MSQKEDLFDFKRGLRDVYTIAQYLQTKGTSWKTADPQKLLGAEYSSGLGYRQILTQINPTAQKSGSGCGV